MAVMPDFRLDHTHPLSVCTGALCFHVIPDSVKKSTEWQKYPMCILPLFAVLTAASERNAKSLGSTDAAKEH